MENLPIDIHCSKLLDWLISRRHCSKEWQKEAYQIREKINHAIQDMPENPEIVGLLSGTYINFFHCRRIVEILKLTEADSKNIFGFYSSQRMKDWNEIVKMYENDNVYLSEAAQILQRLVQYEVPGIKKQIAKCNSSQEECHRKEAEYSKLSKEAERQFYQECLKIEISHDLAKKGEIKIRAELLRLAENLPEFLEHFAKKSSGLKSCMDYYARFRQHLLRKAEPESNLLPFLNYLHCKGNTTYFEWKTGKKPDKVEPLSLTVTEEATDDTIDFGFDEADIDFGEIQTVESGVEISATEDSSAPAQIEMVDEVARGLQAFTVLEHAETQQLFVQDLMELEAFLTSRSFDLNSEHPSDFLLAGQGSRDSMGGEKVIEAAMRGDSDVKTFLKNVKDILGEILDPNRRHLLKIRGDPRYLEHLTEELDQKRGQSQKYVRLGELIKERRAELGREATELKPKLDLLVRRTKELQKQVESEISKRYNGRSVNIMGSMVTVG